MWGRLVPQPAQGTQWTLSGHERPGSPRGVLPDLGPAPLRSSLPPGHL